MDQGREVVGSASSPVGVAEHSEPFRCRPRILPYHACLPRGGHRTGDVRSFAARYPTANKRLPETSLDAIRNAKSPHANRNKDKHLCLRLTKYLFYNTLVIYFGRRQLTARPAHYGQPTRPSNSHVTPLSRQPSFHATISANWPLILNHFHHAPPATSFLSGFRIVAGVVVSPISLFPLQSCERSKSFICHTSNEWPANSFACHTSETALAQVLCLPHLRPPPPGPFPGCVFRLCELHDLCVKKTRSHAEVPC